MHNNLKINQWFGYNDILCEDVCLLMTLRQFNSHLSTTKQLILSIFSVNIIYQIDLQGILLSINEDSLR